MSKKRPHAITFDPKLGRTHQSFKAECDINSIMKKFRNGGLITHVNRYEGKYGDFTNVQDYQTSLNQVKAAQDAFASLPSDLRAHFENDPGKFLGFVLDPKNKDKLQEMGLAPKPLPETVQKVEVVSAPPVAEPQPKASPA